MPPLLLLCKALTVLTAQNYIPRKRRKCSVHHGKKLLLLVMSDAVPQGSALYLLKCSFVVSEKFSRKLCCTGNWFHFACSHAIVIVQKEVVLRICIQCSILWLGYQNCSAAHCKKSMVILTNKNGYLSCTFVLSTLGTEQRYKECAGCVGYHQGGIER